MRIDIRFLLWWSGEEPKLELNLWDFGAQKDDCFLGLTLGVKPSVSRLGKAIYDSVQSFFPFFNMGIRSLYTD